MKLRETSVAATTVAPYRRAMGKAPGKIRVR
jgi:hypothetical protein